MSESEFDRRAFERRMLVGARRLAELGPEPVRKPFLGRDVLRRLTEDLCPVWHEWPASMLATPDRIVITIERPS